MKTKTYWTRRLCHYAAIQIEPCVLYADDDTIVRRGDGRPKVGMFQACRPDNPDIYVWTVYAVDSEGLVEALTDHWTQDAADKRADQFSRWSGLPIVKAPERHI